MVGHQRWDAIISFMDDLASGMYDSETSYPSSRANGILSTETKPARYRLFWTDEDIATASSLWDEGLTHKEIASRVGRTVPGVSWALGKRGKKRRTPRPFTKAEEELMVGFADQGFSCERIGRELNRYGCTIRRHFVELGLDKKYRINSRIKPETIERARAMRADGMKWNDIATELGHSYKGIRTGVGADPLLHSLRHAPKAHGKEPVMCVDTRPACVHDVGVGGMSPPTPIITQAVSSSDG